MAMRGNRGLDSSEREQQMVPAHEMEQIQEPDRRNLQLCFESRLPESFFTGKKVEGQPGELIPVKLIDRSTGHVVASGPLSSLKLDVVVLHGDFKNEDVQTWENFKSHVVKEREGKGPLLAGDLQVSLKEGVGYLGELKFTDNSSWTQSREFKLGVKVASGFYQGIRVHEAITDAFKVKDRRGISYKKHDLPTLDDYVWRLKNIGKNGAFHKKLNKADIKTVREFLWKLGTDDQGLKKILGNSMSGRMWETLVEHAQTCDRSRKYYSAENLSDSQKVFADTLKKEAYAKWKDTVEYDGLLPLEMNPSKRACSSQTDVVAPESCPSDIDLRVSPTFLTHVAHQPGLVNPGLAVGAPVPCQPPSVPSREAYENSMPDFEGLVNPGLAVGAPVPCQPPSVPSREAYENSMPDFEGGKYYSAETLPYSQKVLVNTLKRKAYDNLEHIVEYDGRMLDTNQSAASLEQVFMNPGPAVGDDFFNHTVAGVLHGFSNHTVEHGSSSWVLSENYEYGSSSSFSSIGDMVSVPSGKYHVYYADNAKKSGVVFKIMPELCGLIEGGEYNSAVTLSDSQKVFVNMLEKKAYENWMHVVECDDRMLLNMKQSKRASSSRTEVVIEAPADYHVSLDQQVSLAPLPSSVPPEQTFMNSVVAVGGGVGYDENFGNRYPVHSHRSNAQMQLESNTVGQQMQLVSSSHQSQITRNDHISQPESASCFGFQSIGSSGLSSNLISYDDQSAGYNNNRGADEEFSEEGIRMRSHEMLENDDMQQLLRLLSTGAAPANASNDGYPYSSYIQPPLTNFNFKKDHRLSSKVVLGWLRLKAALRWGIFIRKKAAERRAQLVELED